MNSDTRTKVERRLIAILVEEPSLSLNDIYTVIDSMRSGASAAPRPAQAPKAAPTPKTSTPKKTPIALPDLRSKSGRDTYDGMIFAELVRRGGNRIPARALGERVPGDGDQRLASLKRLASSGKVSVDGQRAATRYTVNV
ncbi:MAG: hypothetical protein HY791_05580 [Deltaproteobacteria bacterium]|nr:hypothetical protein [Deltaproteobacteria bacterium]